MSAIGSKTSVPTVITAPPLDQQQGLSHNFASLSMNDKVANAAKPILQKDLEPSMLPVSVGIMDSYLERVESASVLPVLLEHFSTNKDKEEGQIILQAIINFVDGKANEITLPSEKQSIGAKVFLLDELNAILRRANASQIQSCISFLCTHCPNLRALNFSQTKVGKETVQLLPGFPHLERLDFNGGCAIRAAGEIVSIAGVVPLTDADFEPLLRCTNLKIVDISAYVTNGDIFKMLPAGLHCLFAQDYQSIAEEKLALLGRLTQLRVLDLTGWSKANYSDKAFDFLSKLTELETLILNANTTITEPHFKAVAHVTKLRTLNVGACRGMTDAALEAVSHLPELISLDVSKTPISSAGFIHLANCKKLEVLRCHSVTHLTDGALTHIKTCKTLTGLDLSLCGQITSVGFSNLQYLTQLDWLSLSMTQAKNDDLQFVVPLKRLRYLDLSYCNYAAITFEAFKYLFSLKQLEVLKVQGSTITKMILLRDSKKKVETLSEIQPYMPKLKQLDT